MELVTVQQPKTFTSFEDVIEVETLSTSKPFIEANTIESSLPEIKQQHLVPVFVKDNACTISIAEFIEATQEATNNAFKGHKILSPSIRLSHPIKGRIPSAKNKSVAELLDTDKTLYYERCAFIIEVPDITSTVNGNTLSLTIGGVKSYSLDNLYSRKGSDEHFKIFIGFQNKVCTNLCVSSDGFVGNLAVKNLDQLQFAIASMIQNYDARAQLYQLEKLSDLHITETQFALLMGRCRMYNHLPSALKSEIEPMLFGDNQLGAVCKDFYRDNSFCKGADGNINLWNLYNLFTGSNKSSYIDSFLDKSVNAFQLAQQLASAVEYKTHSWFLT
jgi:hypothetical protein